MSLAVASVLIDIFVQVVSLLIYVGAGVGIVLDVPGPHRLSTVTFVMLAIALPAVAGFFLALNFGAFDPVVRWLVAVGEKRRWSMFAHVVDLGDRLQQIWRNHRGLSGSFFVHVVTVFFGAVEVWIAFYLHGPSGERGRLPLQSKASARAARQSPSCCPAVSACRTAP